MIYQKLFSIGACTKVPHYWLAFYVREVISDRGHTTLYSLFLYSLFVCDLKHEGTSIVYMKEAIKFMAPACMHCKCAIVNNFFFVCFFGVAKVISRM